jgi:ankyrin repeat protein
MSYGYYSFGGFDSVDVDDFDDEYLLDDLMEAIDDDDGSSASLPLEVILSNRDFGSVINERGSDGQLPITYACRNSSERTVNDLICVGAWISEKDADGTTCLMAAAKNMDVYYGMNIMRLLLQKQAHQTINHKDNKGNTALIWAAKERNLEIIKLMLTIDAIDVNAMNKIGESALSLAATHSVDMVKVLLDAGATVTDTSGASAIAQAIKAKKLDVLEVLLSSRSDWGGVKGDELALMRAALSEGGEEAVERIIAKVMEWGGGGDRAGTDGTAGADAGDGDGGGAGAGAGVSVDADADVADGSRKRKREAGDVGSAEAEDKAGADGDTGAGVGAGANGTFGV